MRDGEPAGFVQEPILTAHAVFVVVAMRVVTAYAQVLPIAADLTVR